jgi:hypothetical protein
MTSRIESVDLNAFKNASFSFTKLRKVVIENHFNDDLGIALLDAVPSITHFKGSSYSHEPWYGLSFLSHLSKFNGQFLCAPNLKELVLDSRQSTSLDNVLGTSIKRLVYVGKENNAALQKMEINWSQNSSRQFV